LALMEFLESIIGVNEPTVSGVKKLGNNSNANS
jgi:hypothetical protein